MFSGDWNLRVGLEREEQPPRAAVQVWEERTVFVRLESAHCSRDRHTERLRTLVARLKLHLCVMLLIFEIDMPFHLLIKKKKQKNLKRKKKKRPDLDLHATLRLFTAVLVFKRKCLLACFLLIW